MADLASRLSEPGLNKLQLATLAGIHHSIISRIESGGYQYSRHLFGIADVHTYRSGNSSKTGRRILNANRFRTGFSDSGRTGVIGKRLSGLNHWHNLRCTRKARSIK